MATLFISESTLKERSLLDDNVDIKTLLPIIEVCQDRYILPLLGSSLFSTLKAHIEKNTLTISEKSLLNDYIAPALTWYITSESYRTLTFRIRNKAVLAGTGENLQLPSERELQRLKDDALNKAEWYAQRLADFLMANPDSFPDYISTQNSQGDSILPTRKAYSTGLNT